MAFVSTDTQLGHHPLGAPIPKSDHAVCCSLPTLRDVINYENRDPEVMRAVRSGYPRFVLHSHIMALTSHLLTDLGMGERTLFAVADAASAQALVEYVAAPDARFFDAGGWYAVHFANSPQARERGRAFLQHTGTGISSRQAEDALCRIGLLDRREPEGVGPKDAETTVHAHLQPFLPTPWLRITNSGMNAFYAAFKAVRKVSAARKRRIYLQLGWLYLDTQRVLERLLEPNDKLITLLDVFDDEAIAAVFRAHGSDIAAVITELPNNPQVETLDLAKLNARCLRHGVIRIYDPSVVGCVNVDLLPYTDILTLSLTKYAAHRGDVMIGALALNPESPFYSELAQSLENAYIPPYLRDLMQLARQIPDMEAVVRTQNNNSLQLAAYLQKHPGIRRVRWPWSRASAPHYRSIARSPESCGSVITIELSGGLARFYDRTPVVKGPSFGTDFTLMCPFLYLAHYDLVSTSAGRAYLNGHGMDPDLVRISVGTENFADIRAAFELGLS